MVILKNRKIKNLQNTKMAKNKRQSKIRMVARPSRKRASAAPKDEVTRLGYALRALGSYGGGALGAMAGMPGVGSSAGHGIGASISKWLGSGDYEVTKNSVVSGAQRMGSTVPDMHKANQSIIVRHKEFITTVKSSTGFTVQDSFDINPGNESLFPWLAGVAARFQEYKIRGMVYHYVPTSGAAVSSTNAALGAVMLQTSYRASDIPPFSKLEMLNEYNSNESVPCEAFCHPIECDPSENPFNIQYIRSSEPDGLDDKLLYDLGRTHVAVQGCQTDGFPIGDLWVTYEIELKKPLVSSSITQPFQTFGALSSNPPNAGDLFGGLTSTNGKLRCTLQGNTITFPKGRVGSFQIMIRLGGFFSTYTWANTVTLTGCTLTQGTPGVSQLTTSKGGVTDTVDGPVKLVWILITDPSIQATVTVPGPFLIGTILNTALTVTRFVST